jgi:hypothetical protein
MDELSRRVTILWTTVYGPTERNGLRGDVSSIKARIEEVEKWQQKIDLVWAATRWLALILGTIAGVLLSGPAGRIIADLLLAVAR